MKTVSSFLLCIFLSPAFLAGTQAPLSEAAKSAGASSPAEALREAKSVKEMDELADALVRQRSDLTSTLAATLRNTSSTELKARACYVLGIYKTETAVSELIDNIDLKVPAPEEDMSKIPRWRFYPCRDALAYLGKPAERRLIGVLMETDKELVSQLAMEALLYIEGYDETIDLVQKAAIGAEEKQAERIKKILGKFKK